MIIITVNDNNTESFIYVEEGCNSNFDEGFLTLEDYDFTAYILSTTYSGIYLSPVMNICASPVPFSLNFVTSIDVYHFPRTNTLMMTPTEIVSDEINLFKLNYYYYYY